MTILLEILENDDFLIYANLCIIWLIVFFLLSENLVEDLLDDFEFEIQVPYLLYRNAAQEVNGIWFYNKLECEEVANLFSRYCPLGLH